MNTREDEMAQMRSAGMSLQAIGDVYGLTRERVRQILDQYSYEQLCKSMWYQYVTTNQIENFPVEHCLLKGRVQTVLERAGCRTLGDVKRLDLGQIDGAAQCGAVTWRAIVELRNALIGGRFSLD